MITYTKAILDILSKTEVFRGLSGHDYEQLCEHSKLESFEENETIIQEGEINDALYVVLKGHLKAILLRGLPGRPERRFSPVRLSTMTPGDSFGEYSLIDRKQASCSVIAVEASEVLKITGADFETTVNASDHVGSIIYRNLLQLLIRRLRDKDKELDLVLFVG
jgi:CRP-like cAMP-binding protein